MRSDALSVFDHLSIRASLFFAGRLCSGADFALTETDGYLHVLRSGTLLVEMPAGQSLLIDRPSLLFYSLPLKHRFTPVDPAGADLVCSSLSFTKGDRELFLRAIPPYVILPLEPDRRIKSALDLLFQEADHNDAGQQLLLSRLSEVVVIQVMRHLLLSGALREGLLAAMSDVQLSRALTAINERLSHPWTLNEAAQLAGMSRTKFAQRFKETLGYTFGDHLQRCRVNLAERLLRSGIPVKQVAHQAGYANASALARAFKQQTGMTPGDYRDHE